MLLKRNEKMRKSGILLHISSLPSEYGIGKFGKPAYDFVDFLHESGVKAWQVLPLSPTSYGDSPYQSFSSFAGNPYFIDFKKLCKEGLLEPSDYKETDWQDSETKVNYTKIYNGCFKVLEKAFDKFNPLNEEYYKEFTHENAYWLNDYALFMALKFANGGKPWYEWKPELAMRESAALEAAYKKHEERVFLFKFIQFEFFKQWLELKAYANKKGIEIIGDIPIYTAYDSVDVWTVPELFQLDAQKKPLAVAGCPPDEFSPTGQLWGNPLYDWDEHERTGFGWWIKRMKNASVLYDTVRIDHFRGFESYYAIEYGNKTAETGEWKKGPGLKLFRAVEEAIGKQSVIAEDLGFITPEVRAMVSSLNYPGMKILQFGFGDDAGNEYLPHNYSTSNCIAYIGTHDNETLRGWIKGNSSLEYCKKYLGVRHKSQIPKQMLKCLWGSNAQTAVVQIQDLLKIKRDGYGRMNKPGTIGGNWTYRIKESDLSEKLRRTLRELNEIYGR
jgi:4-alpha-glucanotransferase